MAANLQKVPCGICLTRKVTFSNNSVIYRDIELKFGMKTNFEPLTSESNIKSQYDVIMSLK